MSDAPERIWCNNTATAAHWPSGQWIAHAHWPNPNVLQTEYIRADLYALAERDEARAEAAKFNARECAHKWERTMNDLIERLRAADEREGYGCTIHGEAASEIVRLTAALAASEERVRVLIEALVKIHHANDWHDVAAITNRAITPPEGDAP